MALGYSTICYATARLGIASLTSKGVLYTELDERTGQWAARMASSEQPRLGRMTYADFHTNNQSHRRDYKHEYAKVEICSQMGVHRLS